MAVNSSDSWDNLDTINSTQMEQIGVILNIKESWFTTLWNAIFGTKDTDDLNEGSTNFYDNQSWNESHADNLYIAQAEESNLNVNSSDFWDILDTVADISGSLITNDLNWINQSQANSTGDIRYLNLSGTNANQNINIGNFNFTTSYISGKALTPSSNHDLVKLVSLYGLKSETGSREVLN